MNKQAELEKIRQKILSQLKCPLKSQATNLVFGKGNPNAKILFIGEAPGEKEDLQGIPFVGKAGKQLDKLLNQIELTIDDIYITNILKYRPPKNRDPKIDEIFRHTPYLIEQIKIINPQIIATLGNFSTKFILALNNYDQNSQTLEEYFQNSLKKEMKKIPGIAQIHGQQHTIKFNNKKFKIIPIYHPSAIVYRPSIKQDFENDFKTFAQIIGTKFKKKEQQKSLI